MSELFEGLDCDFDAVAQAAEELAVEWGTGRPAGGRYVTSDGEVVPSVSEILRELPDPAQLAAWKLKQVDDGEAIRDTTARRGTLLHELMLERLLRGEDFETVLRAAPDELRSLQAFAQWVLDAKPKPIAVEVPRVSETWRYGGTLDLVAEVGGKLTLVDLKTGSGVYEKHWVQAAAYDQLWRNCHGRGFEQIMILNINSKTHRAKVAVSRDVSTEWQIFLHAMRAIELRDQVRAYAEKAEKQWMDRYEVLNNEASNRRKVSVRG